jgi:hypothetical protein
MGPLPQPPMIIGVRRLENDKLIWPHCAGLIWPHPWGRSGVGDSFLGSCAGEPVAVGAGLDDVGVEGEPVDDGGG